MEHSKSRARSQILAKVFGTANILRKYTVGVVSRARKGICPFEETKGGEVQTSRSGRVVYAREKQRNGESAQVRGLLQPTIMPEIMSTTLTDGGKDDITRNN